MGKVGVLRILLVKHRLSGARFKFSATPGGLTRFGTTHCVARVTMCHATEIDVRMNGIRSYMNPSTSILLRVVGWYYT